MKIIKPQDLPFTSNIPEPDPNQGEAVYSADSNVTYPFDGATNAKSAFYDSTNDQIKVLKDSSSLVKSITSYSPNYAKISDSNINNGSLVKVSSDTFTGITHSDSRGDVILMCVPDEDGTAQIIRRSTDGGQTFTSVNADLYDSPTLVFYYVNFVSDTKAYAFAFNTNSGVAIVKTTNAGASWSQDQIISNFRGGEDIRNIKTAFDGTYLCVFTPQKCARIEAAAGDWGLISSNLEPLSDIRCASLCNASGNDGAIYSVFTADYGSSSWVKIYRTTNGGVSWAESKTVLNEFSNSYVKSILYIGSGYYYYFESFSNVAITNFTGVALPMPPTDSCSQMKLLSNGKIAALSDAGYMCIISDSTKSASRINYIPGLKGLSLHELDDCIAVRYSNGFYHAPTGDDFRFSSIHNSVDNSTSGAASIDYYSVGGSSYAIVNAYTSSFSVSSSLRVSFNDSRQSIGQLAADDTYTYQLVRSSLRWSVYRFNRVSGDINSTDLGDAYTQNIDDVGSNPSITFIGYLMHVPINTVGLTVGKFDKVLSIDKTPAATVALTPNQVVSGGVVSAFYFGSDSFNWLLENNTTEIVDSSNFDSLGGYREGDEVISTSTHRVYRATTNTVDTPEAGSKKTPPTWTDVGPTNKYAFRDIYIHNRTISQNNGTTDGDKVVFNVTFENSVDSISFFGLQNADQLVIYYYDESGPPSMETKVISLIDYEATIKTGEQTLLESFVVIGDNFNEDAASARIELRPDDSGNAVAVGRMIIGKAVELGVTQYGAKLSIEDFSRRERDEFGNFTIVPRNTAKNIDFDVKMPKEDVNFVFTYLSKLTTIPCVFLGDDDDAAVQVYGYYSDYTHNIDYPSITSATISVEGLT